MNDKITIAGTAYPLKFGFGAFRILGEKWNCKGVQGVINEFQNLFPQEKEQEVDITFEASDKLADVAFAGISNACAEELPDVDDCINALLFEGQLQVVMNAFTKSLPKQGNPMPVKKTRQTKTTKAKKK